MGAILKRAAIMLDLGQQAGSRPMAGMTDSGDDLFSFRRALERCLLSAALLVLLIILFLL